MRDAGQRLYDILDSISLIEEYACQGRDAFESNQLVQTFMVHHLQIIGEAASRVPKPFQLEHPEIPWALLVGMRNILVHDYFGIDLEEVWTAIERDIPDLSRRIRAILSKQEGEGTE